MDEIAKQLEAINKTLELIFAKLLYFPPLPLQPTYPLPMAPQYPTAPVSPFPSYPQGPWVTWGATDCQTSSPEGHLT